MKKIINVLLFGLLLLSACTAKQIKNENEPTYFTAINQYLVNEIDSKYLKGDICIPAYTIIAVDERNADDILVWGDFWVFNYNIDGDTLKTVSGGSHPGLLHIKQGNKNFKIISFEQVADGARNLQSAKKIFGDKYPNFHSVNSNAQQREKVRAKSISRYVEENNLKVTKYQDYGWPAKQLPSIED